MTSRPGIDDHLAALKADTEALPEGPDKSDARQALSELQRLARETKEIDAQIAAQHRAAWREESTARFMFLAIGLALACAPVYAIITGRAGLPGNPPFVWKEDPVAFVFLVVVESLFALVALLVAAGLTNFGPPRRRSPQQFERDLKELQAELAADNSRRGGVPWWVSGLVVVGFLAIVVNAVIKMS